MARTEESMQTSDEQAILDAKSYYAELLGNDAWYGENEGKVIAVSAHPRAYVIASDLEAIKRDPAFAKLGIWYRCRVARDPEKRKLDVSPRTRLLAR